MQKNKNRKGLALGAIFALVTSLFAAVPAQANESAVVGFPTSGLETQTTMLATEAFDLSFRLGNNVGDSLRPNVGANPAGFGVIVTKPAGVTVSAQTTLNSNASTTSDAVATAGTEFVFGVPSSYSGAVAISLPSRTSVSAAVAITVTPFLDLDRDGVRDNGETLGTPITLNFVPWSALGAAVTFNAPLAGNVGVTASVTVTQGTINWAQLDGHFTVGFSGTLETETNGATYSAGVSATSLTGAQLADANYSFSARAVTAAASGSPVASYSATLYYAAASQAANAAAPAAGTVLVATRTVGVVPATFTGLTISPVAGDNLVKVTHNTSNVRPNSTFVIDAFGITTSKVAGATEVTVATSGVEFSATQGVSINGVNYTTSAGLTAAKIVAGTALVTVGTFGQTLASATTITFTVNAQLQTAATHTVTLTAPVFTAGEANDINYFAAAPGEAVTLNLVVKDQYGVVSSRLLQRISASANLSGSASAPVIAAVVDGKATVVVTPTPATRTGSATVTLGVEHFNADAGVWVAQANPGTITLNVSALANGFTVSPRAAASASISYAIATDKYSWSSAVTGSVIVAGSVVTVAGEGLVFSFDGGKTTASDSLTFRTKSDGKFEVNIAGTRAGDHEVTFTAGAATAVTTFTIDPAVASAGTDIEVTGPETALPNRTLTYTGSVVDALGNPVADADVTVTVLGPVSLILGSQAVKTDVDGEFTFRVQTSANDEGDISVTATYNKNGATTLAKDKISAVALTTVAAPVVVTADAVTVEGAATVTTGLSTDVVVTVVDADGNALAGRNVSLRSSGPGFLNVQSAVSDTDGKVVVKFIATAQAGEVVITAVVDGKVGTHTLKVEAPVVVVPEVNAVIGSFNGRWAVRVENAKGSVVSVKVGNRWFKFTALNDNYMFSRASRTGAELPVAVYVNGQLENVATITIK